MPQFPVVFTNTMLCLVLQCTVMHHFPEAEIESHLIVSLSFGVMNLKRACSEKRVVAKW